MKTKDVLIGVFALLLLGGLAYVWLAPGGITRAPATVFKTLDGEQIDLNNLRGRPVLVTFWATDCPGCIKEMPHLVDLYHELSARGLEIIGVAVSWDRPDHVIAMARAKNLPYRIALDVDGRNGQAFGNVRLTPTSFLIAPDGRIVHQTIGELDMDRVRRLIEGMLSAQTALRSRTQDG